MANFHVTYPSTDVTSGPIQIIVNGNPTNVNKDTTTPSNDVGLPVSPVGYSVDKRFLNTASTNLTGTLQNFGAVTGAYWNEIEIFNLTGSPLILSWPAGSIFIGPDGIKRQAIGMASGTQLQLATAQGDTVSAGYILLNAFG